MPRQKRSSHKTHLAIWLQKIIGHKNISIVQAAKIAGCAPSVLHGWMQGSYPSESIGKLKTLANHYGYAVRPGFQQEHPDQKS